MASHLWCWLRFFCYRNFGSENRYEISVERKPENISRFRTKKYCLVQNYLERKEDTLEKNFKWDFFLQSYVRSIQIINFEIPDPWWYRNVTLVLNNSTLNIWHDPLEFPGILSNPIFVLRLLLSSRPLSTICYIG
jgi:hypothetical protein